MKYFRLLILFTTLISVAVNPPLQAAPSDPVASEETPVTAPEPALPTENPSAAESSEPEAPLPEPEQPATQPAPEAVVESVPEPAPAPAPQPETPVVEVKSETPVEPTPEQRKKIKTLEHNNAVINQGAPVKATTVVDGNPDAITVEKVSVDDAGNRLLVLVQTSKPVECFVFERRDPPSLYIQFVGAQVFAGGDPIQVVGIDPLAEVRYGFTSFNDASAANKDPNKKYPLEYLELKLTRPVFYHVQQEGWVVVVGLDRTTSKVEVPDLNFRFDKAKYEGAGNLPPNPRDVDFVSVAQANSRLLAVSRDEAELAKFRVFEARRALFPALTARASKTDGKEVNPFPSEDFEGFEATAFKREEYGLQINQPIYQSGRLYGAYSQAKLNKQMAIENVRKQAQDLTYEMKKAYASLLKYQSILRVRRELVAQGEVIKDLVRKKHRLELTSKSEVLNVTAQADQAQYQLTSDEQDVSLARLVVISLLNQSNPVPDPIPGALSFARLSFNVESIISWAQEHRPDVRIATLNAELARHNMKASQGDRKFKLDASGFVGRSGAAFADDDFTLQSAWNVGLRASRGFYGNTLKANFSKESTAPDLGQSFVTETQQQSVEIGIMDGFPGLSGARQAELQWERAKAELVEASRKAEFEVRQTYYNLEKSARQLDAVREDMKYRQKDLEITREKVKLGLAELSQLMAAEVAYAQAQVTEQDALSAYNVALAEMDRVAGAEVVKS